MSSTISLVFTNIAIGGATCSPLDTSVGRESEIPVLVNILEKVTLLTFSIRMFGSVSVLGSQSFALKARHALGVAGKGIGQDDSVRRWLWLPARIVR